MDESGDPEWGRDDVARVETAVGYFERPLAEVEYNGVMWVILRHPDLLIPDHIWQWIDDWKYTRRYRVPIPYIDRHPCWLDSAEILENILKRARVNDGRRTND